MEAKQSYFETNMIYGSSACM